MVGSDGVRVEPDDATGMSDRLARAGVDAAALKPTENDLSRARDLSVSTLAIDYEGREHLPDADWIRRLAADRRVVVTTPVRADGFDPLGDDSLVEEWLPRANADATAGGIRRAVVAGHPAYLSEEERERSVAPRFGTAVEGDSDVWVGTEGVEEIALATGHTQYELLSRGTDRRIAALRAAGFEGGIAVYAPVVLTDDEDAILDAVGDYVGRRSAVATALPDGTATDASATGRARDVLSVAARDFALVGSVREVGEQTRSLREAGATAVVGYPARGIDAMTR
jgi:hypothetical protein